MKMKGLTLRARMSFYLVPAHERVCHSQFRSVGQAGADEKYVFHLLLSASHSREQLRQLLDALPGRAPREAGLEIRSSFDGAFHVRLVFHCPAAASKRTSGQIQLYSLRPFWARSYP